MTSQNKLLAYLSKGSDPGRNQIVIRRELHLGGHIYSTQEPIITSGPKEVIKKLGELESRLPSGVEFGVENDPKFQGLEQDYFERIKSNYEKTRKSE